MNREKILDLARRIQQLLEKELDDAKTYAFVGGHLRFFSAGGGEMVCLLNLERGDDAVSVLGVAPTPALETRVVLVGNANKGMTCSNCGGCNLKPSGTCQVCLDCGSTSGCS